MEFYIETNRIISCSKNNYLFRFILLAAKGAICTVVETLDACPDLYYRVDIINQADS